MRFLLTTAQLFCMAVTFIWGWDTGEIEYLECVIPPIPTSSVAADKLWDCMRCHSWTRPIWGFGFGVSYVLGSTAITGACHRNKEGLLPEI